MLDELNDQNVKKSTEEPDKVKKVISVIFKCEESGLFKQCGLALRESGTLEYLWNYRIVD